MKEDRKANEYKMPKVDKVIPAKDFYGMDDIDKIRHNKIREQIKNTKER